MQLENHILETKIKVADIRMFIFSSHAALGWLVWHFNEVVWNKALSVLSLGPVQDLEMVPNIIL